MKKILLICLVLTALLLSLGCTSINDHIDAKLENIEILLNGSAFSVTMLEDIGDTTFKTSIKTKGTIYKVVWIDDYTYKTAIVAATRTDAFFLKGYNESR